MMKIAIVSSFPVIVRQLTNLITTTQNFQIIWTAKNGQEAIKLCTKIVPDLIIMDLVMPIMDGIAATRIIMQSTPCAILMLTNSLSSYHNTITEAIKLGAIDVLNTPNEDDANTKIFLNKIKAIHNLIEQKSNIFHRRERQINNDTVLHKNNYKIEATIDENISKLPKSSNYLVAIGASTGGPSAVLSVLQQLSASFPAPIVVVQHVEDQFISGLAAWFEKQIALTVKIAQDMEFPLDMIQRKKHSQ